MAAIKTKPAPAAARPRTAVRIPLPCLFLGMLAFGLRSALPDQIAIDHFDEGVYSSNNWFGEADRFRYPFRALYAPPLLPSLIEWSLTLFGQDGWIPTLPNLLAGTATAMLMFIVCRRYGGPAAGWAGGILAATSDFNLLFSRTALTDVLFGFWMLMAIWLLSEAMRLKDGVHTFAAGLAISLAWWTKYNGWLILAMGGASIVVWGSLQWLALRMLRNELPAAEPLAAADLTTAKSSKGSKQKAKAKSKSKSDSSSRETSPPIASTLLVQMGAIALLAGLFWLPVWIGLEGDGGYGAVARNHRGYFVGWEGWLDSLAVQYRAVRLVEGWSTSIGLLLALLVGGGTILLTEFATPQSVYSQRIKVRASLWSLAGLSFVAGLIALADRMAGAAVVLTALGAAGCLIYALTPGSEWKAGTAWGIGDSGEEGPREIPAKERDDLPSSKATSVERGVVDPPDDLGGEVATAGTVGSSRFRKWLARFVQEGQAYHWLPAAWFFSLLLATPLYAPYPRLQVPWWIAAWIGTAILLGRLSHELFRWGVGRAKQGVENRHSTSNEKATVSVPENEVRRRKTSGSLSRFNYCLTTAGLLVAVVFLGVILPEQSESDLKLKASGPASRIPGWENRTSTERIARDIAARLGGPAVLAPGANGPAKLRMTIRGGGANRQAVVLVFADPALFYHLRASGVMAAPAGNLAGVLKTAKSYQGPVYLAAGPHAFRTPEFVKDLQANKDNFQRTMSFYWRPSLVVRLDSLRESGDDSSPPLDQIAVYLVKK